MLVHLPTPITIIIDFIAWFIIHIGISYTMTHRPLRLFKPGSWIYRKRNWERNGRTYEKLFRLKSWKKRLPDGAAIFRNGFEKRHL